MKAKFRNAGQACIAANRILVQDSVHDLFCQKLTAAVAALTVGPAADGPADIGPLINPRAIEKVVHLVAQAEAAGARRLAPGPVALGGNFVAPTILVDVTPGMALSCEEIFGPVAAAAASTTRPRPPASPTTAPTAWPPMPIRRTRPGPGGWPRR
ncbi:MAG: gabD [Caulobacter sp.]|nr:gabD [Caulobacter sp.]